MNSPDDAREGGYVQPELEYERGKLLLDPSSWFDAWRKGTEQAQRRTAEVRVDIAYGKRQSERLDLYLPSEQPRNLPFAAFVPGGWRREMRSDSGFPAKAIHHQGAAFVAIGFDTAPAVDLAGQVDQVRRAWRYLVENAKRFGLDPARGHLLGHATGAHLAALTAFDPRGPTPVSAVLLSGVYDLDPVTLSVRNEDLGLDPETTARLDPIRFIAGTGPEVLIAWGDREPDEFRRQSRDFACACKLRGLRVIQRELCGRSHFDTSLELANPHSTVLATLRAR